MAVDPYRYQHPIEQEILEELRRLRREVCEMRKELNDTMQYIANLSKYAEQVSPGVIDAYRFSRKLEES